jgi:hypothetical protein
MTGTGKVNIRKALEDFMHFIPDRCRTENPVVHISLNPHPDDRLTDTDMENKESRTRSQAPAT